MAQPVFITEAGSLGTIPEGKFFQIPIQAYDPDDPDNPAAVYYLMVAGELPEGIQCTKTGLIEGVPKAIASLQGVPTEVSRDVTSKFVVRAYTESSEGVVDRVRDRTFLITVTGQDVPDFVTPPGNIGTFYDGDQISISVEYSDTDPADTVTVQLASGTLPPGLSLSTTGVISGTIEPLTGAPDTAEAGYDNTPFSVYPFDYSTRSYSRNYQFTLEITDGKDSNLRTFEIYVYSKDSMVGDTTDFTGDNSFITADVVPLRTPVLLTLPQDIGRVRHDNWFAFQFVGEDLDGDAIEYSITTGSALGFDADGTTFDETGIGFDLGGFSLPPGLTLDSGTGWLYGYIPSQGVTEVSYTFAIRVRKRDNPTYVSDFYYFTMTIVGDIENTVTWITDSDLGTVNNGDISLLQIQATTSTSRVIKYRLKQGTYSFDTGGVGVYNKLPQGLSLLEDGTIAGRVSFNTFTLDSGTTTFDKELRTRLIQDETTFDTKFTFTVNAYSDDGLISVFKTFTVQILRVFDQPYVGLYVKAMPPQDDRDLVDSILDNQDVIPPQSLFRPNDPYFGRSTSVRYNHAYGLSSASLIDYVTALDINHYKKNVVLGQIKTARALDAAGNTVYEVVYSEIQDNLVNNDGISVNKEVTLNYPINPGDSTEIDKVYPNSLDNMRDQVINTVGQLTPGLPLWMTSKQENGQVLGFVPAWVIAYTLPGESARIAYQINRNFPNLLNRIDFQIDRYELEGQVTRWWTSFNDSTLPGNWASPSFVTLDRNTGDETTLDSGSLRLVHPVDVYGRTDEYDKYLVFPRTNILG